MKYNKNLDSFIDKWVDDFEAINRSYTNRMVTGILALYALRAFLYISLGLPIDPYLSLLFTLGLGLGYFTVNYFFNRKTRR